MYSDAPISIFFTKYRNPTRDVTAETRTHSNGALDEVPFHDLRNVKPGNVLVTQNFGMFGP